MLAWRASHIPSVVPRRTKQHAHDEKEEEPVDNVEFDGFEMGSKSSVVIAFVKVNPAVGHSHDEPRGRKTIHIGYNIAVQSKPAEDLGHFIPVSGRRRTP